jgi:hypothetical protein
LAQYVGVGAHSGGLAGAGRADPGQQQPLIARERGDEGALAVVQVLAGDGFEPVERRGHRWPGQGVRGGGAGGVEQPLLGV